MSVILLLRHGQASFGAANYDVLSPKGFRQAEALGRSLAGRGVHLDAAVSGSLARQRDTARTTLAAAGATDLEARVDPGWDEYDHGGVYAGFAADQLGTGPAPADAGPAGPAGADAGPAGPAEASRAFQKCLDVALTSWSAGVEGTGVNPEWSAFSARVAAATDAVVAGLGSGQTAAVFTSGGVISAVCTRLLALPSDAVVAFNRVTVNAGITKVVCGRRGATLISFNDHAHFEGPDAGLLTYR